MNKRKIHLLRIPNFPLIIVMEVPSYQDNTYEYLFSHPQSNNHKEEIKAKTANKTEKLNHIWSQFKISDPLFAQWIKATDPSIQQTRHSL